MITLIVSLYEASSEKPRGIGGNRRIYWQGYPYANNIEILETIFDDAIQAVPFLTKEQAKIAQAMAAFMYIWGLSKIPKWFLRYEFNHELDDDSIPRMLYFYAMFKLIKL
ncbi:hypothetical protein [Bergeriella denitrificans]|uniref:hypothetical protein n=1 Tax=Bergeriella denitrificans TaxID=494 RepID=UPI000825E576|nr:hypothetical protein [Bergeriella denitrificans]